MDPGSLLLQAVIHITHLSAILLSLSLLMNFFVRTGLGKYFCIWLSLGRKTHSPLGYEKSAYEKTVCYDSSVDGGLFPYAC